MKYRNTKTGAVIDIKSKLSGSDWEPVEAPKAESKPTPKRKRATKR